MLFSAIRLELFTLLVKVVPCRDEVLGTTAHMGTSGVTAPGYLHRRPRFPPCPGRWQCGTVEGDKQAWSGLGDHKLRTKMMNHFSDSVELMDESLDFVT